MYVHMWVWTTDKIRKFKMWTDNIRRLKMWIGKILIYLNVWRLDEILYMKEF